MKGETALNRRKTEGSKGSKGKMDEVIEVGM
jgi:hypothetical protein